MATKAWSGPLFLVGASRSGTAMMRAILNRHPRVRLAGETHYFDDLRNRTGLQSKTSLSAEEEQICADYFRALDHRPYGMRGDPERSTIGRAGLIARARTARAGVDGFFEAYCRMLAERDGKEIWGEKTPRHVFRLVEILTAYPDAKVIYMARDPRAMVASYRDWRNQGGLDFEADSGLREAVEGEERRANLSYNIIIASLLWRGGANAARRGLGNFGPERICIIRYEDVVTDPVSNIRSVCGWLGLSYDDAMLEIPVLNSSFDKFARSAGVNPAAAERWRSRLSSAEIAVIQFCTKAPLVAFGYRPLEVGSFPLRTALEFALLPVSVLRILWVNRNRTGNIFSYLARRMSALLRR